MDMKNKSGLKPTQSIDWRKNHGSGEEEADGKYSFP
jgi:hypothetical protein